MASQFHEFKYDLRIKKITSFNFQSFTFSQIIKLRACWTELRNFIKVTFGSKLKIWRTLRNALLIYNIKSIGISGTENTTEFYLNPNFYEVYSNNFVNPIFVRNLVIFSRLWLFWQLTFFTFCQKIILCYERLSKELLIRLVH